MTDAPIATAEHPSPFDALAIAEPGEIRFPLLERDPLFEELVLLWAEKTRSAARNIEDEGKRNEKLAQCNEAEQIAWAARDRRLGHVSSAPAQRAGTNADTREIEQWRIDISKGTQHLRNAAYEIGEAKGLFHGLELLDADDHAMLDSAQNIANQLASEREPKRASFAQRPTLADIKGK